jgi:hypothetical protein
VVKAGRTVRLRSRTIEVPTDATKVLAVRPKPDARGRIAEALRDGRRPVAKVDLKLTDGGGIGSPSK